LGLLKYYSELQLELKISSDLSLLINLWFSFLYLIIYKFISSLFSLSASCYSFKLNIRSLFSILLSLFPSAPLALPENYYGVVFLLLLSVKSVLFLKFFFFKYEASYSLLGDFWFITGVTLLLSPLFLPFNN
jgi:hypothetical protein